jgi:hypothetical protein
MPTVILGAPEEIVSNAADEVGRIIAFSRSKKKKSLLFPHPGKQFSIQGAS